MIKVYKKDENMEEKTEEKVILMRIDRGDIETTLEDVLGMIEEFQERYPDMEIFWDGDEYAICGRKKKEEQKDLYDFVD